MNFLSERNTLLGSGSSSNLDYLWEKIDPAPPAMIPGCLQSDCITDDPNEYLWGMLCSFLLTSDLLVMISERCCSCSSACPVTGVNKRNNRARACKGSEGCNSCTSQLCNPAGGDKPTPQRNHCKGMTRWMASKGSRTHRVCL